MDLSKRELDQNLCKEIMITAQRVLCGLKGITNIDTGSFYAPYIPMIRFPESKYKFSRANWYVANFDTQYYFEVEEWCKEQFGPHPKYPDAWSRWVHTYEDQIHFRDEQDYIWFVLRWGGQ